jgi:ABC-2 type transport system permease protein
MNVNIFKHEFRTRLKSLAIWSISLTALILFFFSIFPSFADQAVLTKELMNKFPPALLEAFGLGKVDMSTLIGYYSFVFVFIQLCMSIQAGNYGFGLVSIEESELTADFLLTKPVSRFQVIFSKLLAAFTTLFITDVVIWGASLIGLALFNAGRQYDFGKVILLMSSIVIFQLFFLSVGMAVSLLVKRVRSVTPYSLGLGFGAYVLSAFSGVFGDVKLEYITPFKQLDPMYIVQHSSYDTHLTLITVTIIVISFVASFWLYARRDIPAVS